MSPAGNQNRSREHVYRANVCYEKITFRTKLVNFPLMESVYDVLEVKIRSVTCIHDKKISAFVTSFNSTDTINTEVLDKTGFIWDRIFPLV